MPKTVATIIRKREEAAASPVDPSQFTATTTAMEETKKTKKAERMEFAPQPGSMSLDTVLSLQQQTAVEQLV